MEENKNYQDTNQQEDLIKLMQAIDNCIESMDNLYFLIKTREMLSLSKDN